MTASSVARLGRLARVGHLARLTVLAALAAPALVGCAADANGSSDGDEIADSETAEPLSAGVNGKACLHSAFNCKLRVEGGNRLVSPDGTNDWALAVSPILDGNGNPMGTERAGSVWVNYGQTRAFGGQAYVLATSTDNHSAGWVPERAFAKYDTLHAQIGNVDGRDPQMGKMACYEVKNSDDEALAAKKVVYDTTANNDRAGDYMALVRADGRRYANLAFSVPGDALGAPSIDIFPAGTKFQRVGVPTSSGNPHLTVRLYEKAANGHYTKPSGVMAFYYGYVKAADGVKRFGWMSEAALTPSAGCK